MAVAPPVTPVHAAPGARALVELQARELLAFVETWREALAAALALPATDDPAYASLEALLRHLLRASRYYVTWCCEKLELPDPGIAAVPDDDALSGDGLDSYLAQLLAGWSTALVEASEAGLERPEHPASWGTLYCVDAMLEHAVMHPIRHRHQLLRLMGRR